jgi:hypothetical protein
MRDVYIKGFITELTQGAIINNCISEDYCDCNVWGCVITPRCDLANKGKVSTFHYLPVINFDMWVDKVMRKMLLNDYYSNLKDRINQRLEKVGAGKNLIDIFRTKEAIIKAGTAKMKTRDIQDFEKDCHNFFDNNHEAEKEYLTNDKHYKKILNDLKSNGIHGCYLIESWENADSFKIILLRDVRRMSISTRKYYEEWENRGFEDDDFYRRNDVSDASKEKAHYQIICSIKPPFIEHIMQSFSYNFTRIGIPSFDERTMDLLTSTIKTVLS